ncbi:hypothetical protein BV898_06790 [Hypsibius exemplaris]|uniref:Uncharacterized protein n=1 Tax=Hypsibius exemplaris TaxID=2072580 RepID=A0A1W0WVE2_HYPEX|nr:hypothetical protein BV898_06790 [Hypsibius exemplaris]
MALAFSCILITVTQSEPSCSVFAPGMGTENSTNHGNGGLFQRNTSNITSGTIRRLNEDAPPTTVSPVQTIRSTTVTTTTISAARPGSGMNNRGDSRECPTADRR